MIAHRSQDRQGVSYFGKSVFYTVTTFLYTMVLLEAAL